MCKNIGSREHFHHRSSICQGNSEVIIARRIGGCGEVVNQAIGGVAFRVDPEFYSAGAFSKSEEVGVRCRVSQINAVSAFHSHAHAAGAVVGAVH